jgi:uncharacterized protein YuzE
MKEPKLTYFADEDILHIVLSEEHEANSVELAPSITAELNDKGELIGIEILNVSWLAGCFLRLATRSSSPPRASSGSGAEDSFL